jgi:hypothetical protein
MDSQGDIISIANDEELQECLQDGELGDTVKLVIAMKSDDAKRQLEMINQSSLTF